MKFSIFFLLLITLEQFLSSLLHNFTKAQEVKKFRFELKKKV
jgi:hypothetical protein